MNDYLPRGLSTRQNGLSQQTVETSDTGVLILNADLPESGEFSRLTCKSVSWLHLLCVALHDTQQDAVGGAAWCHR